MFLVRKKQRFEQYLGRLHGYALAMSRDGEVASDLVQDCVIRVLKARKTPVDEAAYRAWLFTIIRNLWRDHLRSIKRLQLVEPLELSQEDILPASYESAIVNVVAVRQAFENLSDQHRDILALVDVGGFGYEECAKMLDIPKGTVMSRVSRGRAALAHLLNENNVVAMSSPSKRKKL